MKTPTKRSAKGPTKQQAILTSTNGDRERFWLKVKKTDGCWLWTSSTEGKGYGTFSISNRAVKAHRASYFWANRSV